MRELRIDLPENNVICEQAGVIISPAHLEYLEKCETRLRECCIAMHDQCSVADTLKASSKLANRILQVRKLAGERVSATVSNFVERHSSPPVEIHEADPPCCGCSTVPNEETLRMYEQGDKREALEQRLKAFEAARDGNLHVEHPDYTRDQLLSELASYVLAKR